MILWPASYKRNSGEQEEESEMTDEEIEQEIKRLKQLLTKKKK